MSFGGSGGGGSGSIQSSTDVFLSSPQADQVLSYNAGTLKWVNANNASAPVSSVAGKTGAVTIVKADVGLGNVDNTSDANKPISSAVQTALDAKASTSHSHTTGNISDFASEIRKTDANVYYGGSAYPLRSTVTNDAARRVRWIGPVAPTIGSGYAVNNLDIWEQTT